MYETLYADKDVAKAYHTFRPTYPESLAKEILQFIDEKLEKPFSRKLAIDVGCGSGQSTKLMANHFDRIIGLDISEAQIFEAKRNNEHDNVEFTVGSFEKLPAEDNSVSLIFAGTAFHFFEPFENFYKEVKRVLVPGGCLAVFSYALPFVAEFDDHVNSKLNDFRLTFFNELDDFKTPATHHVANHYKDFELPFNNFTRINSMKTNKSMNLDDYAGYLGSWSFYRNYVANRKTDPLKLFRSRFEETLQEENIPTNVTFTVEWPVFLLCGRN
ncbi:DgyrCDS3931 [Dimorphilus gyrociliatus]|uniref:DgyrCDS3931 n=1 Tax=Dimorphilus gyrociliatus TaxID=2664684 RepID=A0A7I8VEV2_9ANNE|nr:DgyrCDS3931 [Dimorphilus gyrociliatus]